MEEEKKPKSLKKSSNTTILLYNSQKFFFKFYKFVNSKKISNPKIVGNLFFFNKKI